MTTAQLISNLGTIARSRTRQFMKTIEEGTDFSLIGQFYFDFFQHFWLQSELLSHQNIMIIADASVKAMEVKTLKLGKMNQVIILSVK
jgi:HSP90 family molecular chaperone